MPALRREGGVGDYRAIDSVQRNGLVCDGLRGKVFGEDGGGSGRINRGWQRLGRERVRGKRFGDERIGGERFEVAEAKEAPAKEKKAEKKK